MNTIDFAAAQARLRKLVELRNTYVDVEFDVAELTPPARPVTLGDMLMDVVADCGGVASSIAADLRLGR